jgi:hypothetical protein
MNSEFSTGQRILRISKAIFSEVCSFLNVFSWFQSSRKFRTAELTEARQFLDHHGWVIVSDVFTVEQIRQFRIDVERSRKERFVGDPITDAYLGGDKFILNDRLLTVVNGLLSGKPVYFGDSTISSGFETALAFHKDNPDRNTKEGPDWQSPYTTLRFGLYLQDHVTHSGGLALRDGSHLLPDITKGRPFAVPTSTGDVVVWTLRTTHSGFATRMRGLVNAFIPLTLMSAIAGKERYEPPKWLFRPLEIEPRMALFATFGIDDSHLHRFVRYLTTREYAVSSWRATVYSDAIRCLFESKGVRLLDISGQAQGIDPSTLHVGHMPLPADEPAIDSP